MAQECVGLSEETYLNCSKRYKHKQIEQRDEKRRHQRQFIGVFFVNGEKA